MKAYWTIFEILVNIFQGWLFAYFCVSVFDQKVKYKGKPYYLLAIWISCSALLTLLLYLPLPSPFIEPIPMIILLVVLTQVFCSGSLTHKVFWSIAYIVMFACILYLVVTVALSMPDVTADFLFNGSFGRIIYVITVNAVVTSLTFVLIRIVRRSKDNALKLRVIAVSTALFITNLTILLLLLEVASVIPVGLFSPVILVISAIAVFIANALVLWMFHHITVQNARVMQLTAVEQRIEMQTKHQEEIGQIERELRQFRHDIHSHFQYLMACIESGEIEQADTYLRERVTDLDAMSLAISTGNPVIDAILNVKAHVANSESIAVDVDAHIPEHLPIADVDLVVIIGNILDNAIEASSHLDENEERRIKVVASIRNRTLMMTVINAFTDVSSKKGIRSLTRKFKGEENGLGLKIVSDRVTACGGYVTTKTSDHIFETGIIIPISQPKTVYATTATVHAKPIHKNQICAIMRKLNRGGNIYENRDM